MLSTLITDEKLKSLLNLPKSDPKIEIKDWYLKMAIEIFVKELQIDNEDLLQGKVEIRKIPTNTYVMREDSHKVRIILIVLFFTPSKHTLHFVYLTFNIMT